MHDFFPRQTIQICSVFRISRFPLDGKVNNCSLRPQVQGQECQEDCGKKERKAFVQFSFEIRPPLLCMGPLYVQ